MHERWYRSFALTLALVFASDCSTSGVDGGAVDADEVDAADATHDAAVIDAAAVTDADTGPSSLRFAIVGDTRPPNIDDTAHYPTAIITKIWQDVAAASPAAQFAVSTGDYMFAATSRVQQTPQLDLYLRARANYSGPVYAAMGNHECTGATASNCGTGTANGVTRNYTAFMARMVTPAGFNQPWYVVHAHPLDGSWTAKLVFVACNAWTSEQATWLESALAEPTTYTFVVRHEGTTATTAPCVTPSKAIIARHPLTLLIVGHTHTYAHYASDKEVIVGNGGAPLTSGVNYGYALVDRRADGTVQLTALDYQSGATLGTFAVHADGSHAN